MSNQNLLSAIAPFTKPEQALCIPQTVMAFLFGVLLIYGVRFAQPSMIHEAAHDVRHASGLPCH